MYSKDKMFPNLRKSLHKSSETFDYQSNKLIVSIEPYIKFLRNTQQSVNKTDILYVPTE